MTDLFPHHPKCECDFCFVDDLNAVLTRFLERRLVEQEQRQADEIERLGKKLARAE